MIIIRMMGGLGNQLYQYALYERFRLLGKDTKLDILSYESMNNSSEKRRLGLNQFPNIVFEACSVRERKKFVDDSLFITDRIRRKLLGCRTNLYREGKIYDPDIFKLEDSYLLGYWNCEKYYEDIIPLLRDRMTFPMVLDERNSLTAEKIASINSVSLHIRRGDYLSDRHAQRFGSICTDEYYESAVSYIKERVDSPHFFVFSDDSEYARNQYNGGEFTIVDWNQGEEAGIYDMKLMSMCGHNICANSTFSKWGAILNANPFRIRISPQQHTSDENIPVNELLYLWKDWIFINQKGDTANGI